MLCVSSLHSRRAAVSVVARSDWEGGVGATSRQALLEWNGRTDRVGQGTSRSSQGQTNSWNCPFISPHRSVFISLVSSHLTSFNLNRVRSWSDPVRRACVTASDRKELDRFIAHSDRMKWGRMTRNEMWCDMNAPKSWWTLDWSIRLWDTGSLPSSNKVWVHFSALPANVIPLCSKINATIDQLLVNCNSWLTSAEWQNSKHRLDKVCFKK